MYLTTLNINLINMKKYFLFLCMFSITPVHAFDYSCFEKSATLTGVESKTIKVITDNTNNYYFQSGELLNTKTLSEYEKKFFTYEIDGNAYTDFNHSFDQYDTNKTLIVHFPKTLIKNSFSYDFSTNNRSYHFEISKDGIAWNKIEDDITTYDIDYLKISFDNKTLKNTSIYTLNFFEPGNNVILVNSTSKDDIVVYSNYVCDNEDLSKWIVKSYKTMYFPTDTQTKTYTLSLKNNPNYNPQHTLEYINRDIDNDWVVDSQDNCVYDYNPNQLDSTSDGSWDACSDKDSDGILWKIDNCPTVNNGDQTDDNKNGIWDVCETDTDKDSIFDALDNCSLIANKDQFDTDGDGIWDTCDNCSEIYNADQKDIDKDRIWDSCDTKDDRYIESNKTFFISILIIVALLFLWWIGMMISKLKNMKK